MVWVDIPPLQVVCPTFLLAQLALELEVLERKDLRLDLRRPLAESTSIRREPEKATYALDSAGARVRRQMLYTHHHGRGVRPWEGRT